MRFFLHHRKEGTLTTLEMRTEREARVAGAELNVHLRQTPKKGQPKPKPRAYVVEIRHEGMSEYQGFYGADEPYIFVQPDAQHRGATS